MKKGYKHLASIITVIALLFSTMPISIYAAEAGTAANPYIINSASALQSIKNNLSAYYRLSGNIDMSGIDFSPLGNDIDGAFKGTIDGNGYTISNLTVNTNGSKYVGLVGYLEGTVKNLKLSNVNINGQSSRYVGTIAGCTAEGAEIENCTAFSGSITGSYIMVDFMLGGITGCNNGSITGCVNYLDITNDYNIGGIASYNTGSIDGCKNYGDITLNSNSTRYSGGIVGNSTGTITDCSNSGAVSASSYYSYSSYSYSSYAGGISGSASTITGCSNSGAVSAFSYSYSSYAGGISGSASTITGCSNSGAVSAESSRFYYYEYPHAGGISCTGSIYRCINKGTVCSTDAAFSRAEAGGICTDGTAYNSINEGTILLFDKNNEHNGTKYDIAYRVYNISFKNTNSYADIGQTYTLPIDYADNTPLKWYSNDESVVTVDSTGTITGISAGSAMITAETDLVIKTSCIVTISTDVKGAEIVSLNKTSAKIAKGETVQLAANVNPPSASNTVTWGSSNSDIASVSSSGLVTGNKEGSALISARMNGGPIFYCVITVSSGETSIEVSSVSIPNKDFLLAPNDAAALNVSVLPSNASNPEITYTSDNEDIATVNSIGIVTAHAPGVAVIRAATSNGIYDECIIRVVSDESESIILTAEKAMPGDTVEVSASVTGNPGISACKLQLEYDSDILTPVSVNLNSEFGGTLTSNIDDNVKNGLNIVWYSTEDVNINGNLFIVKFKVSENANVGSSYPISVTAGANDICNINGGRFAFNFKNTEVMIDMPIPGDIYEDGNVTVYDLTLAARYVTKLEELTARQLNAADVNNDSIVDIRDVVILARYIAGIEGVELQSAEDAVSMMSDEESIILDSVEADEDGIAYIPVRIQNNSGIAGFVYELEYDRDKLELLEIIPNTELMGGSMQTNLGQENGNPTVVSWYRETNINENGCLFTVKARLKTENETAKLSIKPMDNNMCNQNSENLAVSYEAAEISPYTAPTPSPTPSPKSDIEIRCSGSYITVTNIGSTQRSAAVIIAAYNGERIAEIKTFSENMAAGESKKCDITDGTKYKVLVWDSISSMNPLCKATVIE